MMFEVLTDVLLIQVFWDMIGCLNCYSLAFYTALYLKRPEPFMYVYGIKLFGCLVSQYSTCYGTPNKLEI